MSGTLLVVALVRCGRSVAVYVRAHGYGLREGGGIGRGGRHFGVNQTDSAYLVDNGCKKGGRDCQATMRVWKQLNGQCVLGRQWLQERREGLSSYNEGLEN